MIKKFIDLHIQVGRYRVPFSLMKNLKRYRKTLKKYMRPLLLPLSCDNGQYFWILVCRSGTLFSRSWINRLLLSIFLPTFLPVLSGGPCSRGQARGRWIIVPMYSLVSSTEVRPIPLPSSEVLLPNKSLCLVCIPCQQTIIQKSMKER